MDPKHCNVTFNGLEYDDALINGTDYTISGPTLKCENQRYDAGTCPMAADITLMNTAVARNYNLVNGTGFAGSAQITARPVSQAAIAPIQAQTYTGNPIAPDIQATYNGMTLLKDVDYRLTYEKYVNAGTATVTVSGMGNYDGQTTVPFQILPKSLEKDWLKMSGELPFTYNGAKQVPIVRVSRGNLTPDLIPGTDYTVTYTDSKFNAAMEPTLADTYTLTVIGKGNYQGKLTAEFVINKKPLTLKAKDQVITYGDLLPQGAEMVTVDTSTALAAGDTISSVVLTTTDKNVTTEGKVTIGSVILKEGETDVTGSYELTRNDGVLTIQPLTLTTGEGGNTVLTAGNLTCTGAEQTLTADKITLKVNTTAYGEETLTQADYTITGNTGTKVGDYTLTIKAQGNFRGEIQGQWKIAPNLDAIKNLTVNNVKSSNKAAIQQLQDSIQEENLNEGTEMTQEWTEADETCDALLEKLAQVEAALEELEDKETNSITKDNVKLSDEAALEQDLRDYKATLAQYTTAPSDNLTAAEKRELQGHIARIEAALAAIAKAQEVIEEVEKLPDSTDTEDTVNDDAIHAAKDNYDELSENEQKMVDNATDDKLGELYEALTDYRIIKGAGAKWIKGSNTELSFTANGAFSKFESVLIDGKQVTQDKYDLEEGSTIVSLKTSYLKKLSVGKHTIQVVYTDGQTNAASFQIAAKSSNPTTGDYIMGTVAIMALSGAALAVLLVLKKRKK